MEKAFTLFPSLALLRPNNASAAAPPADDAPATPTGPITGSSLFPSLRLFSGLRKTTPTQVNAATPTPSEHNDDMDWASDDSEDGDSSIISSPMPRTKQHKHWNTESHFPAGRTGAANWDFENLKAAQRWACPCGSDCLSEARHHVPDLHDFRRECQRQGRAHGFRDWMRYKMADHWAAISGKFTNTFRIGASCDNCLWAYAFAAGWSYETASKSRTDVTHDRPNHAGRTAVAVAKQTEVEAHYHSYIRSIRAHFEGAKGDATGAEEQYYTGQRTESQRWKDYEKHRNSTRLPVLGNEQKFAAVWRTHTEIHVHSAKGHGKCSTCAGFELSRLRLAIRQDTDVKKDTEQLEVRAAHTRMHHPPPTYPPPTYPPPTTHHPG